MNDFHPSNTLLVDSVVVQVALIRRSIASSFNLSDEDLFTDLMNRNMFNPRPNAGKNGSPVMIPPKDFFMMKQLFQINRFNLMASDRIPLNRSLPDMRKKM